MIIRKTAERQLFITDIGRFETVETSVGQDISLGKL